MTSRFTHINETFICENCRREVPAATTGCRNHCPFCLTSKHVDINPGDRANPCQGLLRAVNYELDGKKGIVLIFRCDKCGKMTRNKANRDDRQCPDDYDRILALTPHAT